MFQAILNAPKFPIWTKNQETIFIQYYKNQGSNKIGLTFLGFFYNFLEYIWLQKKKKNKNL